jgi:glycosyltransferase involved in cell wall biosynthesis
VDKIFTSSKSSLPYQSEKVIVVGQAVNNEKFAFREKKIGKKLVSIGRVTRVKNLDKIIRIFKRVPDSHQNMSLELVGPYEKEDAYFKELKQLIDELQLNSKVVFSGPLSQEQIPNKLYESTLFFNLGGTQSALDKATIESLSCGTPVMTDNRAVRENLPEHLVDKLYSEDIEDLARKTNEVLSLKDSEFMTLSKELSREVSRSHSLDNFFDKILARIQE